MDVLVAAFDAIARLAPTADREALASLEAKRVVLDAAATAALGLGVVDDAVLAALSASTAAAKTGTATRLSAIESRQASLALAVPADRRSRGTLRPMPTPELLHCVIEHVRDRVTDLARNHGMPLHALMDGAPLGRIDAYDVGFADGDLRLGPIDGPPLGSWPLARIAAISVEEEDFGILLDDGTLVEIQEDADFVWTETTDGMRTAG